MTLIVDTAPMVALADRRDPMHPKVESVLSEEPGDLVIPAPTTAEIDYLLGKRCGQQARLAFLDDLAAGRFVTAALDAADDADDAVVADLERRYPNLDAGLADLAAVVIADRYATVRILTFDERHFRTLRTLAGGRFTLLP